MFRRRRWREWVVKEEIGGGECLGGGDGRGGGAEDIRRVFRRRRWR